MGQQATSPLSPRTGTTSYVPVVLLIADMHTDYIMGETEDEPW